MAAILRVKDENGNIVSIPAIKGDKGEKGDPGEKGEKGERGAPGTVDGLPSGGTTGQILTKNSDEDGDAGWKDAEHDLFNADGKTYGKVISAYESGKVCYVTYAGTKLLNNGYSGNRNPFKFSGENSNGEVLTATLSTDGTLTFGGRGDYHITTASQTFSKEKQSQARQNIGITGIVTSENVGNPEHTTDLVDYSGFQAGSQLIIDQTVLKNQGTSNSGKFLGIGADGIVVPTEVSGGGESEDPLTGLELIVEHTVTEDENDAVSLVFTQESYPKINNNKILLIYITRPEAGTSPWLEIRAGTQTATGSSQSGNWGWMMYLADGTNGLWLNNWVSTTASIDVYRTIAPAYGYNGGQVATRTVQFKPYDKITMSSWTSWFKTGMVIKIFGSKTT